MKTAIKRASVLTRITVIVLCVLLLCTFLSNTIYSAALPKVNALNPQLMDLAKSSKSTGTVEYLDKWTLAFPVPLQITTALVKEGQSVTAGTALFEVDMGEISLQIKRLNLAILQIENQLAASGLTRRAKQELQAQLDIARTELEQYQTQVPQDGQVLADRDGIITTLYVKDGTSAEGGTPLIELRPADAVPYVSFTLADEAAYQPGNEVEIRYAQVVQYDNVPVTQETSLSTRIEKKEFDPEKNQFRFYAPFRIPEVNEDVTVNIYEGQTLSVQVYEAPAAYNCVVPSNAVMEVSGGGSSDYVVFVLQEKDGLFGRETYVQQIKVGKLAENGMYTAIDSKAITTFDKVVVSSDGALSSGMTVQVIE